LKKSAEIQIEKYVRFPDEMRPDESMRIKQALEQNPELKMLADWFTAFYDVMDESGNEAILLINSSKNNIRVTHSNGELTVSSDEPLPENVPGGASEKGLTPFMVSKVSMRNSRKSGYVLANSETGNQSVEIVQGSTEVTVVVDNDNSDAELGILLLESEAGSTICKINNGLAVIPGVLFWDKQLTMTFYLLNRNQKAKPDPKNKNHENNEAISGA